ncbi:serine/threonine-protein kinase [Actinomadura livida]|uniref:non-specific serine/threonine protein kinase n=1 Tax=Actinomadura livida TaxID=79909 RepID=A0A7W7IC90_9ACTN|nr:MULTISPECIES: serine/threonine-protein kinase [Actinomadura]MBB4774447.1 tetratricopeptide (TPR) repeat protein [Actinomadura catellatispora]GGT82479.1 protein kinase [Actinomadura livida]
MQRGDVLGERERYVLDQPIGRGGMGEVWRAYDRFLDRRLAVKFTRVSDEALVARFEHEARSTAWFEHPGVPTVYDYGSHEGSFYLVMQYVDGITVANALDEVDTLSISWASLIAAQVCAVLTVAHRRPLVHRDLKPSNLMLCPDGSVKVLDFGAAVGLGPGDVRRTTTGLGAPYTPGYTAMEQVYGSPSPHSDLYSLGCVLYEMLTGRQVFLGNTPYEVLRRHEEEPPIPASHLRPDVPTGLDALVLQLLAKQPVDRPANADEVYRRLLEFVTSLHPLPGIVDTVAPQHLYANAISRIQITGTASRTETPAEPVELPTFDEVVQVRAEAGDLAEEGRYTQAAELLSDLIEPARLAIGDEDPEYMGLRLDLADVLFHGGDYRRAVHAYRAAAVTLAEWYGPDDPNVLACREQEAVCQARLGATRAALRHLQELLDDVSGGSPYDALTLRVRERVARLKLAAGETDRALKELTGLLADLTDLYGDDHPQIPGLRLLLDDLNQAGTG